MDSRDAWGWVPSKLAPKRGPIDARALEIKTIWGSSTVLDAVAVTTTPRVFASERGADDFHLAERLGTSGTNYAIRIPSAFSGYLLRRDGSTRNLDDLLRGVKEVGGAQGCIQYPLEATDTLFLRNGTLTFQIRYVRRVPTPRLGFFDAVGYAWVNALLLAFFLHAVAIAFFLSAPATEAPLVEDLFEQPRPFVAVRLGAIRPSPKMPTARPTPSEVAPAVARTRRETSACCRDRPTSRRRTKADDADGDAHAHTEAHADAQVDAQVASRTSAQRALSLLFGRTGTAMRDEVLRPGDDPSGELVAALGRLAATEMSAGGEAHDLVARDGGRERKSWSTISGDRIGSHRDGRRDGDGDGDGDVEGLFHLGRVTKSAARDIPISLGGMLTSDGVDRGVIQSVIKRHLPQIRYCYEKVLIRSPTLFGKVATRFVIASNGQVQSAEITESTLGDAEVERCVVAKIQTWRFPRPRGEGIVVVRYPFVFTTSPDVDAKELPHD